MNSAPPKRKLIVAITGASGAIYGVPPAPAKRIS